MAKRISQRLVFFSLAVSLLLGLCSCRDDANTERNTVNVFAAASLKEALEKLGVQFTKETGVEISFNFAGSNVLAQQIVASARADLFISADSEWMDLVQAEERLGGNTRIDLLANRLVGVCSLKAPWTVREAKALCELDFKFLCMGDPAAVPAGRYGREFLSRLNCGSTNAWERVQQRISPSPDVRAALAQVLSRTDAIGIVYRTDYLLYQSQLRLLFEAPDVGIRYPAALTSIGMEKQAAGRFFLFLQSETSRLVFEEYGFSVPALLED